MSKWYIEGIVCHQDWTRDILWLSSDPDLFTDNPYDVFIFDSYDDARKCADELNSYEDNLPFLHHCCVPYDKYCPINMLRSGHYSYSKYGNLIPDEYVRKGLYIPDEKTI